jgi:hypothetical protein
MHARMSADADPASSIKHKGTVLLGGFMYVTGRLIWQYGNWAESPNSKRFAPRHSQNEGTIQLRGRAKEGLLGVNKDLGLLIQIMLEREMGKRPEHSLQIPHSLL